MIVIFVCATARSPETSIDEPPVFVNEVRVEGLASLRNITAGDVEEVGGRGDHADHDVPVGQLDRSAIARILLDEELRFGAGGAAGRPGGSRG